MHYKGFPCRKALLQSMEWRPVHRWDSSHCSLGLPRRNAAAAEAAAGASGGAAEAEAGGGRAPKGEASHRVGCVSGTQQGVAPKRGLQSNIMFFLGGCIIIYRADGFFFAVLYSTNPRKGTLRKHPEKLLRTQVERFSEPWVRL